MPKKRKLLDYIYRNHFWLHKLLMKNKLFFKYRHLLWNYGGIRAYIRAMERRGDYYEELCHKNNIFNDRPQKKEGYFESL